MIRETWLLQAVEPQRLAKDQVALFSNVSHHEQTKYWKHFARFKSAGVDTICQPLQDRPVHFAFFLVGASGAIGIQLRFSSQSALAEGLE